MTEWRKMPWAVSTNDMAIEAAKAHVDEIAEAIEGLGDKRWIREKPKPGLLTGWTVDDRRGSRLTSLAVIVERLNEAFVTFGLYVDVGRSNRMVYTDCDARVVDRVYENPVDLVRLVSDLYSAAINAEDREPATKEAVIGHDGLDAASALGMFEMADRHGMDPSRPVRIERWGRSPLSPSSTRIVGSMRAHTETFLDETPGRIRMSVHANGSLRLKPEMHVTQWDGFDPMEILHMHRTLSEGRLA